MASTKQVTFQDDALFSVEIRLKGLQEAAERLAGICARLQRSIAEGLVKSGTLSLTVTNMAFTLLQQSHAVRRLAKQLRHQEKRLECLQAHASFNRLHARFSRLRTRFRILRQRDKARLNSITPPGPAPSPVRPSSPAPNSPIPNSPIPNSPTPNSPAPNSPIPKSPTPNSPIPNSPTPNSPAPNSPTPRSPTPNSPIPNSPAPISPILRSPATHRLTPPAARAPEPLSPIGGDSSTSLDDADSVVTFPPSDALTASYSSLCDCCADSTPPYSPLTSLSVSSLPDERSPRSLSVPRASHIPPFSHCASPTVSSDSITSFQNPFASRQHSTHKKPHAPSPKKVVSLRYVKEVDRSCNRKLRKEKEKSTDIRPYFSKNLTNLGKQTRPKSNISPIGRQSSVPKQNSRKSRSKSCTRQSKLISAHETKSRSQSPTHMERRRVRAVSEGRRGSQRDERVLPSFGADANVMATLDGNLPLLHRAVMKGDVVLTRLLLSRGANPELRSCYGWTPLHTAAYHDTTGMCVMMLIGVGANIEAKDGAGRTALHLAAQNSNFRATQVLVSSGANTRAKDHNGQTPYESSEILAYRNLLTHTTQRKRKKCSKAFVS